jgi:uroporphyrinogen decarboxylase
VTGGTSSMERVLTALSHREPDRVPLLMTTTMHGARELGVPLSTYFDDAAQVIEGQLRLQRRYRSDFYYAVLYGALDVEAFGAEVITRDDGPVNAGAPIVRRVEDIDSLEPPDPRTTPCLQRALRVVAGLAEAAAGAVPVVGLVISPWSLPVMQMGFEGYLRLMWEDPLALDRLLAVNEEFCVRWMNAQFAAGATAVGYFDPVGSPTVTPPATYRSVGQAVARRVIARAAGPVVTHFDSGRSLPVLEDVIATGTVALGVSAEEDLATIKAQVAGRLSLVGNLNGIEMRRWSAEEAEAAVKDAIRRAGSGGGFILSDNHGEIPWQVPEATLDAIADAVDRWGRDPKGWIARDAG